MVKSAEFRARARALLKNDIFSSVWLLCLVCILIANTIIGAASTLFYVGGFLIEGFLMYGVVKIFLSLKRGKQTVDIGDLFSGTGQIGDLLLLSLLKNLFILLWALIPIAGVFIAIVKSLSYEMVYFVKHDHPEYDWRQCLSESKKMMMGNKWRLFCLQLSFIGWIIVGALCLGVGTLWVQAYIFAAKTCFYEELKDRDEIPHLA